MEEKNNNNKAPTVKKAKDAQFFGKILLKIGKVVEFFDPEDSVPGANTNIKKFVKYLLQQILPKKLSHSHGKNVVFYNRIYSKHEGSMQDKLGVENHKAENSLADHFLSWCKPFSFIKKMVVAIKFPLSIYNMFEKTKLFMKAIDQFKTKNKINNLSGGRALIFKSSQLLLTFFKTITSGINFAYIVVCPYLTPTLMALKTTAKLSKMINRGILFLNYGLDFFKSTLKKANVYESRKKYEQTYFQHSENSTESFESILGVLRGRQEIDNASSLYIAEGVTVKSFKKYLDLRDNYRHFKITKSNRLDDNFKNKIEKTTTHYKKQKAYLSEVMGGSENLKDYIQIVEGRGEKLCAKQMNRGIVFGLTFIILFVKVTENPELMVLCVTSAKLLWKVAEKFNYTQQLPWEMKATQSERLSLREGNFADDKEFEYASFQ